MAKLGDDADKLRMVFVTVDPARDTPELLNDYLSAFDPRIVGLTGTEEEIAATAKTFHTVYQKVPEENGDFSSLIGRLKSTIPAGSLFSSESGPQAPSMMGSEGRSRTI